MSERRFISTVLFLLLLSGCAVAPVTESTTGGAEGTAVVYVNKNSSFMRTVKAVDGSTRLADPSAIRGGLEYCGIYLENQDIEFISQSVANQMTRLGFQRPESVNHKNCVIERRESGPTLNIENARVLVLNKSRIPRLGARDTAKLLNFLPIGQIEQVEIQAWRKTQEDIRLKQQAVREAKFQRLKTLSETAQRDYVFSLTIEHPSNGAPRYCTTRHASDGMALMSEYASSPGRFSPTMQQIIGKFPADSGRASKATSSTFANIFDSLDNLFARIQNSRGACSIYIDYPDRIQALVDAIRREKLSYNIELNAGVSVATLVDDQAKKQGFSNGEELRFARALQIDQSTLSMLKKYGIDSIEKYREAQASMGAEGYSSSSSSGVLLTYLADRLQAKSGETATSVRQARIDAQDKMYQARQREIERQRLEQQKLRDQKVKEEQQRRDDILRRNKYMAKLSCEFGGRSLHILTCFSGPRYGSNGELEIRSQSRYRLYQYHEVTRAGEWIGDTTLEIPFNAPFQLRATNSSGDFILSLRVVENATQKIVWQKSVSSLGTIRYNQ
jgi:hypothetical protein